MAPTAGETNEGKLHSVAIILGSIEESLEQ